MNKNQLSPKRVYLQNEMAEVRSVSGPLVGSFSARMQESPRFPFGFSHEAVDEELDPNDLDEGGAVVADAVVGLTL